MNSDRVDRGCWRKDDGQNEPLHGSPSPGKYALVFFFLLRLICAMNFVNMCRLGKRLCTPKHA
jgi:hypothetical protein